LENDTHSRIDGKCSRVFIEKTAVKEQYAFNSIPEFICRTISSYILQIQKEIAVYNYGGTIEKRVEKLLKEVQKSD